MRNNKMTRPMQRLLSVGCVLATSAGFIHTQFPAIPDFFIGLMAGAGLGIMIGSLIWYRKKCVRV